MSTNVGQIDLSLILNSDQFRNQLKNLPKETDKAANMISSSLGKIGRVVATVFSVAKILQFGKTCVDVATETANAWIGLNSILVGQGKSFNKAKEFINSYISDGLIPLNDAVTAYKNLASRGYNTEQIQNTMEALKNASVYGRQSSYTMGEAVRTATEGLKNENSILVDNAGVTKNVAKMWEEYAKSIGKTRDSLTQQEKIQAEYIGILRETQFQMHDAETVQNTFTGKVALLSQAFTNMKIAIGNVIQPIAKLFIPMLTAAANAVTRLFTALAGLLSLFGLKADSVETVSSGLAGVAENADKASGALDKAGNSASKSGKKAKGALASWDELNVLNKNDDSGSGSISDASSGIGKIGEDLGATIQKNDDISNLFSNINFEPLINSFNNLKSAAKPIIDNIAKGLKWFYDNVLVPLSKWTIEKLLPSFLNLLAASLRVLNPLINGFKPIFLWFWDNFLQPIAKWTGGIIIDVLTKLTAKLENIGNWMSKNQATVTKMEIAVLGFFGAWKITELMSFIAQAGGVIAALKAITSAIIGSTLAKIADKAETIALTLMYAKDFIVGVAQATAALVKQAAQWVINTALKVADTAATIAYNVATTAATAVTWLFNAALVVLTSPITLVVIAIGGLIAIITLLIKHWDEVSTALVQGWEFIKQKANEIFTSISQNLSNIWNNIKQTAISIWNAIKLFLSILWENIKSEIQSQWNAIKDYISTILNNINIVVTTIWTGIKNFISKTIDSIKSAVDKGLNAVKNTFSNIFNGIWNIVKGICNSILGGIEKMVNGVINGLNNMINALNSLSFTVPDWVPELGGKSFGFNIPNMSSVALPRLAEGGFVKANTPQLAVVGDNRTQGEIIAPEDKIRENMIIAMEEFFRKWKENNPNDDQPTEIHFHFDGELSALAQVLKPYIDEENTRRGVKLVVGGAK